MEEKDIEDKEIKTNLFLCSLDISSLEYAKLLAEWTIKYK